MASTNQRRIRDKKAALDGLDDLLDGDDLFTVNLGDSREILLGRVTKSPLHFALLIALPEADRIEVGATLYVNTKGGRPDEFVIETPWTFRLPGGSVVSSLSMAAGGFKRNSKPGSTPDGWEAVKVQTGFTDKGIKYSSLNTYFMAVMTRLEDFSLEVLNDKSKLIAYLKGLGMEIPDDQDTVGKSPRPSTGKPSSMT